MADATAHSLVLVPYLCGLSCLSSVCLLDQSILDGSIRVSLLGLIANISSLSFTLYVWHAKGALKLVPLHLDPLVQSLV